MTFYNHIESVRGIAIDLTNGRKWRGASDKAAVFDALDAARREYMRLSDEVARLRELVRGLHMAYVGALNECESLDEGLIWEYSGSIEADVAKSKARFEADRHRFDTALRELGIEADNGAE